MKKFLTFLFSIVCLSTYSQTIKTDTVNDEQIHEYGYVDTKPEFVGGEKAMNKFILDNVKYPEKEAKEGINGTCYIGFVIEKDGSITNIKIIYGIPNAPLCNQESIHVISMMPKWTPGILDGKIVRTQFNMPIKYIFFKGGK